MKHFFRYVNDQNPKAPDKLTQIVFEPIKQQLKRDLKKWETKAKKNSENAKKRWDKNAIASGRMPNDAKHADNVIDNVSDNVIIWDSVKENFFNDFKWQEKFCRDKNISPKLLVDQMHEFISDIELREDYKELKDLKNHFTNLHNKNKNGKQETAGQGFDHIYKKI